MAPGKSVSTWRTREIRRFSSLFDAVISKLGRPVIKRAVTGRAEGSGS